MGDPITLAHKHSIRHLAEIKASERCGCFYCCSVFDVAEIKDWCDDGETALCPVCRIDAVIGEASGFPVTSLRFLQEMKSYWF